MSPLGCLLVKKIKNLSSISKVSFLKERIMGPGRIMAARIHSLSSTGARGDVVLETWSSLW